MTKLGAGAVDNGTRAEEAEALATSIWFLVVGLGLGVMRMKDLVKKFDELQPAFIFKLTLILHTSYPRNQDLSTTISQIQQV